MIIHETLKSIHDVQHNFDKTEQLLNKPYVSEVTLNEQILHSKF